MRPANTLFIISDEHTRSVLGAYGNPVVRTPNLDRLAAAGTLFENAYTPSPVCVSARASLATGRWVHETGCWSSAEPYDGRLKGWGHRLTEAGHRCVSIGKLHYRHVADDNGFDTEILPLHVIQGVGWVKGLMRDPLPPYDEATAEFAAQVGAGETGYTLYDRRICDQADDWLRRETVGQTRPWTLFVSFVSPHYPLIAPQEFYDLHSAQDIGPPHRPGARPDHPALRQIYGFYNYDAHMSDAAAAEARLGYYGLVAFLYHLIGRLMDTLDELGLSGDTRLIYTSDHGEMLGDHGMWTKMLMNEQSAGIPMIISGPDVPRARRVTTPVSLVDCHQTIIEGAGLELTVEDVELPGENLVALANAPDRERPMFSEYHDGGSPTGYYMLRRGDWKYVHYAGGYPPQLFNLAQDPMEDVDRAGDAACAGILAELSAALRRIVDPEAVNAQAFADQARRLGELGGRERLLKDDVVHFGFTPLNDIADDLALDEATDLKA